MRAYALIRDSWRQGWGVLDTIHEPTVTISTQRTGWVGDAQFTYPTLLPLGAEVQLLRTDDNQTLWLGKIVERRKRSAEAFYTYKARGICEFFLDLPFPLRLLDYNRQRTGNAQSVWQYHLRNHLRHHSPRYNPIYNLNLTSLNTRDITLNTVRDAYKLYSLLKPCRIVPTLQVDGRINMTLEDMPLTQIYPLPQNAPSEISDSILETANRITITNSPKQLIKDRRALNPDYWELVVPTGASASITVQDPNEYGYLSAYATRIDANFTSAVWVGLRYKETIKAPKDASGNRLPLAIGFRARGNNADMRIRVNSVTSTTQSVSPSFTELAWQITPNADDLTLTIELTAQTTTLPASVIIDAIYCIPSLTSLLNERDYQPHTTVTDQLISYITGGIVAQISSVYDWGGGVYDLAVYWDPFPATIQPNTPVQILQNARYLRGRVISRQNPTTLRVQIDDPYSPTQSDILYVAHNPTSDDAAYSEMRYDTLYTTADAPMTPTQLGDHLASLAEPQITLTAQIPTTDTTPIPQVGQSTLHPETYKPLPIYEAEMAIIAGKIHTIQIRAGSPELTMRALLRRLNNTRTRQL